jgi:quercetin dioxygenase-like cupin family protein
MTLPQLPTLARAAAGLALCLSIAVPAVAADSPIIPSAKDVKWGPAPPVLPKGAMLAVLAGDPGSTGPVSVRLKMPAGYKIPAHWHPTDEQLTVLSGTFSIGMGDVLDMKKGATLHAGGFGIAPANMHHYAWTKTGATIQLNLMGPLQVNYVNPADDPSKAAAH